MRRPWQLVAFPVMLPWRREFWTLPLYFPDLKLGVTVGWPKGLPYEGMAPPPEAEAPGPDLRHFRPWELTQKKAFQDFLKGREEVEDIVRALKGLPPQEPTEIVPSAEAWSLVWQLEKMQADQEAQMVYVDQGQEWLAEILTPEPWEKPAAFGTVPGVKEVADPDLARLRYLLWRRVLRPFLQEPWSPMLLGRSSRAIFLALKDSPAEDRISRVKVSLPGCRSESEWQAVRSQGRERLQWTEAFAQYLTACLEAAAEPEDLEERAAELRQFVETEVAAAWPGGPAWRGDLEIWSKDSEDKENPGPVVCWGETGADILPG